MIGDLEVLATTARRRALSLIDAAEATLLADIAGAGAAGAITPDYLQRLADTVADAMRGPLAPVLKAADAGYREVIHQSGTRARMDGTPPGELMTWYSVGDESVCESCAGMHGRTELQIWFSEHGIIPGTLWLEDEQGRPDEAHPECCLGPIRRCRCWLAPAGEAPPAGPILRNR